MTQFGQWQPISTAPETEVGNMVLLLTDGDRGRRVHVGYLDDQKYGRRPKPYWRLMDIEYMGVGFMRENQPIAWMPLPSTEGFDG